jgi:mono/diheme cytochrome c family protein
MEVSMTRRSARPIQSLIFVLAAGAAQAAEPASTSQQDLGQRTYEAYCGLCHGFGGATGMFADALKKSAPDLTQIAKRNGGQFPERKVDSIIRDGGISGHGTMRLLTWEKYFSGDSTPERADEIIEALTQYLQKHQIE